MPVKVRVQIADDAFQNLEKDLETAFKDDSTMLQIHNELARMCDPYVPFLNNPLSQTIEVDASGVTYVQPYARYQYHGEDFNHTVDFHPLASAYWDEAMLRDHEEEFLKQVADVLAWRMKTYG